MIRRDMLEQVGNVERRLVCGYPKTGRTWLRFMMANALSEQYELDADINLNNVYKIVPNENQGVIDGQPAFGFNGDIPKVEMSHRKYSPEFEHSRLVFMTRDPRDIMVSHWFHDTLQVNIYEGTLNQYVRDENKGIAAFLGHLESWAPHLEDSQVVTYEDMRRSPHSAVSYIFERLGIHVGDENIEKAVARGEIRRMQRLETEYGIAGHDYDRSDPDARRIRAGKIGGYVRYLSDYDQIYIDNAINAATDAAQRIIAMTAYDRA